MHGSFDNHDKGSDGPGPRGEGNGRKGDPERNDVSQNETGQSDAGQSDAGQSDAGMAGRMARTFIHSPLSPLLFVACLFMGVMGLFLTPRQEDPQISVPMVDIFVSYPGASSQQVASLAIDPLERMMSEIPGVKHVYSASRQGEGMVTVQFEVGEQMGPSLVKLYDKLQSNRDRMPPGVGKPLVKPKGVNDVPVVTLTLWSNELDDTSLRLVALEMRQRLKQVPDTADSFIVGGRSEQMRIEIQPARLASFGISVSQISAAVKSANVRKDIGSSESGGNSFSIYSGTFLKTIGDLEKLVVGVREGRPVYLRDVATLSQGPGEAANVVEYYTGPGAEQAGLTPSKGAPAVTIAIAKKAGSNGVTVAQDILDRVEELKGTVIPDNLHIAVTRNYGKTAGEKVDGLIIKLFVATGAVVVLIFMALGFIWQPAFVVAMVIPVVILITVFSAYILGYTIDRVSLFALIFSIGILVDDAIVVVENIYRRWLMKGEVDTKTTIDAVAEVGNPTILATLTVIAALLPMGFVSGMMGPYMEPIPALGSVAMLFSLFAAFMFMPWLVMRIRPSMAQLRVMEQREHRQTMVLGRVFDVLLSPLLDNPRKARLFRISMWGLFLLACSLFYTQHVTVKMLPLDNKPEFNVVVNMPDGTSLPSTANAILTMTQKVLAIKEVIAVQTYAGTASPFNFNGLVRHTYLRQKPWQGDIQIQLLDKNLRARTSHEIAVEVRALLTPLAESLGASIQVVEMPPGPPVLQTMVAEIYGSDDATRRQVARDMTALFKKAPSIVDVDNYLDEPHENWSFEVDRRRARQNGISASDITEQLSMVMGGFRLGDIKAGHELEPRFIVLQAPLSVRTDMNRLLQLPIVSRSGKIVPLHALGKFKRQKTDPTIYHKDLRAVEYVTGEVAGRLAAPIYGMLEVGKLLEDYKTPEGISLNGEMWSATPASEETTFVWAGEWTVTFETFRDMGAAFMVAMVLIYMLVVWEFGSFRIPAIIMAPIPLTLIGIIPGHWLLGAEFTATSMIGWIALAGIIVRNSILLVDFTQKAVEEGMEHRDAVMAAVVARARPILITAFALVAGSGVIISDPIFNGMAISLMFGVLVATALTLFVIPMACAKNTGVVVNTLREDEEEELTAVENEEEAAVLEQNDMRVMSSLARFNIPALSSLTNVLAHRNFGRFVERARGAGRNSQTVLRWLSLLAVHTARLGRKALRLAAPVVKSLALWLLEQGRELWSRHFVDSQKGSEQVVRERFVPDEQRAEADLSEPVASENHAPQSDQPVVLSRSESHDDLKKIKGIGPMIEQMLNRHGYFSYEQIRELSARDIERLEREMSKTNQGAIGRIGRDGWVEQAALLLAGEKAFAPRVRKPVKKAVKSSKKNRAQTYPQVHTLQSDNLCEIRGIGRVIEKILHDLEIRTFAQIASLTPREIERIGVELDKKPRLGRARISRDRWIEQARELAQKDLEAA